MASSEEICYHDFLALYRRSGGGLVAESKISRDIESRFGKLFVPHLADVEVLSTIESLANESAFLLEIIGVPGVGKTKLLTELINGLNSNDFEQKYKDLVKTVTDQFDFQDISGITEKQYQTIGKKKVWVTLNIDEFVGTVSGKNPLEDLYAVLKKSLRKGESLLISGNVGVLENEEAKQSIEAINHLIQLRNQRPIKFIRFPASSTLYWTKEYGIEVKRIGISGDPDFLVSGQKGFQSYCTELVKLCCTVLSECHSKKPKSDCQKCIGPVYFEYLKTIQRLLESGDFSGRLHDIIQYLWLKNTDVYLVARALNIFWGYALTQLWDEVESNNKVTTNKLESLVFSSLYLSKMPSLYRVSEYPLSETNIHRFRKKDVEQNFLKNEAENLFNNPKERLKKRLDYYFQGADKNQYREMIYGGIFDEFIDEKKLATAMTGIARRIILLRLDKALLYVSEDDERFNEIFKEPWGFAKILLGTKVSIRKTNSKKPNMQLMIFHDSVLNEVDSKSGTVFEESQSYAHYLSKREKVLQLKLRGTKVNDDLQNKAPQLHLGIDDYACLRELTRGVGNPDISLKKSTQVKVASFIDALEGFVTHQIRPLIWKHMKEDLSRGDTSSILTRTLGPNTQRCNIKLLQENISFELNGIEIASILKEVIS